MMAQVEINSLHATTMDSTKLLTEKLALARELSSLRPEIDHLQSQAALHKSALSEKLALQRELSALQEDLAMEKRATENAMYRERRAHAEETRVAKRLETVQAEVDKERRERLRIETESHNLLADCETRRTTLETRLDAFKTKLRTNREQLKGTQAELKAVQSATQLVANQPIRHHTASNVTKEARKRTASLIEDDTMIGTPGDQRALKKSKQTSALLGDKSTFSITPFLCRTASVAPDDPSQEPLDSDAGKNEDAATVLGIESSNWKEGSPLSVAGQPPSEKPTGARIKRKVSKSVPAGKVKTDKPNSRAPPARNPQPAPSLEQVAEEPNDVAVGPTFTGTTGAEAESTVGDMSGMLEAKITRRRFLGGGLGRTLFDDEDGETVKVDQTPNGNEQIARVLGRVALGRPRVTARLGGSSSGFGGFSPLKKDKRGSAA